MLIELVLIELEELLLVEILEELEELVLIELLLVEIDDELD